MFIVGLTCVALDAVFCVMCLVVMAFLGFVVWCALWCDFAIDWFGLLLVGLV